MRLIGTGALCFALTSALIAPSAGARTDPLTRRADSIVSSRAARVIGAHVRVSCTRVRGHPGRWLCSWSGIRKRDKARCQGTYRLTRSHSRWKLASSGYSCTVPTTSKPATDFGFNDNSVAEGLVSPTMDAALLREVGANVVRVTFAWDGVEPRPGQYQWGFYDRLYSAMRTQGIRPLFILLWAPRWAWSQSLLCFVASCRLPPAPNHFADAGRMAAALAKRYPEAAGIEIWNEQNLGVFWQPKPDPSAYAALLRTCYLAVKKVAPAMPVVMGGLSNQPRSRDGDWSLHDFLQAFYANGAQSSTDAIAFHPYPSETDPTFFLRTIDDVRSIRNAHHDDARPLWVTELGITTSSSVIPVSELQQAAGLTAAYKALSSMADVRMIIFHTLIEYGSPMSPDFGYGILTPDLRPRPAFCALGRLRVGLFSCNA